jgi:hypothetical protein
MTGGAAPQGQKLPGTTIGAEQKLRRECGSWTILTGGWHLTDVTQHDVGTSHVVQKPPVAFPTGAEKTAK